MRDTVFQGEDAPKKFSFAGEVAQVFDDMAVRSIPLYEEMQKVMRSWIDWTGASKIYDIGCATGRSLSEIAAQAKHPLHLIGVDPESTMLSQAKSRPIPAQHCQEWQCCAAKDGIYHNADAILLNYTLHFIPPRDKIPSLKKLYAGTRPNGMLFISEKIAGDGRIHAGKTELYRNFKRANAYSETEIENKARALEGYMNLFTLDQLLSILRYCGWTCEPVLRWHQFVSIVGFKCD